MTVIINHGSWTETERGKIRFRPITEEPNEIIMKYEFQLVKRRYMWGIPRAGQWETVLTTSDFKQGFEYCKHELGMK